MRLLATIGRTRAECHSQLCTWRRRTRAQLRGALLASVAIASSLPHIALAAAKAEVTYTRQQVYSGSLRYLRVDLGCEITEKDTDSAYLLFRYQAPGQTTPSVGSIEIVERGEQVTLVVKMARLPAYHEVMLRDGLMRKLQEDYGASKPRRARPAPPEAEPTPPKSAVEAPPPEPSAD